MNIFDYLLGKKKDNIIFDDLGNAYLYYDAEISASYIDNFMIRTPEYLFLEREKYEALCSYEIILPDSGDIDFSFARRPYYRMRGVPVTKEQAFEIIRRTDVIFHGIPEVCYHPDYVGDINFNNWLVHQNHSPRGYGWIHVDGTVGSNAITQKYPSTNEFVREWLRNLIAFPYLDLIIAVTYWDEIPPDCLDSIYQGVAERNFERKEYDGDFYKAINGGIYVHDHTIQIMDSVDTMLKYKEYDALYGKDRAKFIPEYYENNGIKQVDLAYLRRCIEAYGVDADTALSKVIKYQIEGL